MSIASVAVSPVQEETLKFPVSLFNRHGLYSNESIWVFLTLPGSVIPMRVLESESIASVKLRIQTSKGIFVRKQKLVYCGRELARNNSCISDYGVTDGNILHLVIRLSNLQAVAVETVCGEVLEFTVERSRNVGYVKRQITERGRGLFDLKSQELICDGEELEDQRLIDDICKDHDTVIHFLVRKSAKLEAKHVEKNLGLSILPSSNLNEKGAEKADESEEMQIIDYKAAQNNIILEPLTANPKVKLPLVLKKLIEITFDGLERGYNPIRCSEGSGGAYFMQDSSGQKYISVFKPIDEEPMAVNNPTGLPLSTNGEGLKRGTRVGEGAIREVAAYILDHPRSDLHLSNQEEKGFAGVPPTVMVKCLHQAFNHPEGFDLTTKNIKIGSLQMFMENYGSCEDMGPRDFPVNEVHKISVLDIRLANADRHAGNILVGRDGDHGDIVLIPIDHGYCLPENFEDCTFDWLYWPQARQPYSPETINYINQLDAERDIELLRICGWDVPHQVKCTLRISTMLLKKGAEKGLSPYAIGSILCRENLKKESVIEQIIREAKEDVLPETSEAVFLDSVSEIMDRRLDELISP